MTGAGTLQVIEMLGNTVAQMQEQMAAAREALVAAAQMRDALEKLVANNPGGSIAVAELAELLA